MTNYIVFPAQCECGHLFLEHYVLNEKRDDGCIAFSWCGFCRKRIDLFDRDAPKRSFRLQLQNSALKKALAEQSNLFRGQRNRCMEKIDGLEADCEFANGKMSEYAERVNELEEKLSAITAIRDDWHKVADERSIEINRLNAKLAALLIDCERVRYSIPLYGYNLEPREILIKAIEAATAEGKKEG